MGPLRRLAAAALLAVPLLAASCAAGPSEGRVLLFHTNDIHGHIERMATVAGLVKAERERRRDVLWLDAGDEISGTPVSTVFRGTPIFAVTSLAGVDAGCLGNHEFDHGLERIAKFREAATFPLLCANARGPDGELLADAEWTVFPVGPVRVGVLGLVTEHTPAMTIRKGNEGARFEPARAALERLIPVVRPKCDLLVALTHVGYDEDVELARAVKGVDVIVGGHSHTDLPGPVQVGDTVVVQAGCYALRLGRLELTVDLEKRRLARWEGRPIVIDPGTQPRDPTVAAAVAELEKKVSATVDRDVGTAARDLGRDDLRVLAERAYREALGADFGLQNDGGIRNVLPKGTVTVRALWEVFPFDNTLVKVRVKGANLPPDLAKRAGKVDPERIYVVATLSFVAEHLDRYLPRAEPDPEDTGTLARDAVVDWVAKHPDLE